MADTTTVEYWDGNNGPFRVDIPSADVEHFLNVTHPGSTVYVEHIEAEPVPEVTEAQITSADVPKSGSPIFDGGYPSRF